MYSNCMCSCVQTCKKMREKYFHFGNLHLLEVCFVIAIFHFHIKQNNVLILLSVAALRSILWLKEEEQAVHWKQGTGSETQAAHHKHVINRNLANLEKLIKKQANKLKQLKWGAVIIKCFKSEEALVCGHYFNHA